MKTMKRMYESPSVKVIRIGSVSQLLSASVPVGGQSDDSDILSKGEQDECDAEVFGW